MKIYFSPLACSLASRIACYEAGADATFVHVDTKTKTCADGSDYRAVHPVGQVPAVVMDDGTVLTENAAVLQFLAETYPRAGMAPDDAPGRWRLRQWLSFVGAELHKAVYLPLLEKTAPEGAKAFALSKASTRLAWVARNLESRPYLLGAFSVADAYLFAVLNWSMVTPVDLSPWPAIGAFQRRMLARPAVARAFDEERALYAREQQ